MQRACFSSLKKGEEWENQTQRLTSICLRRNESVMYLNIIWENGYRPVMKSVRKMEFGVLKRTERGKNYQQFILEHGDYFERMPADAYEVIRVCANIKEINKEFMFREDDGEERVDMCRAIYEIKRDARREGKREGRCEAILELLEDCGEIPEETKRQILEEKNKKRLGLWLKLAAKAKSIEEFCMAM